MTACIHSTQKHPALGTAARPIAQPFTNVTGIPATQIHGQPRALTDCLLQGKSVKLVPAKKHGAKHVKLINLLQITITVEHAASMQSLATTMAHQLVAKMQAVPGTGP